MFQSHQVEVGGLRLHVEEQGSGKPVVFGHSLLCDGTMFAHQTAALATTHRVLNVDFRNHGKSGNTSGPYSIVDQASDYLRVMDALEVERAVIAGLSMGGMAALHLAATNPGRVAGLVLMDTSAGRQEPWWTVAKYMALALAARTVGPRPFLLQQAAPLMFGWSFRRNQPQKVAEWMERFARLQPRGLYHAVRMVALRPSIEDRLGSIRAPALVIVGAEDKATPPDLSEKLAKGLPRAKLRIVERAGHLSTVEQPEELTRLIRGFLTEIDW